MPLFEFILTKIHDDLGLEMFEVAAGAKWVWLTDPQFPSSP